MKTSFQKILKRARHYILIMHWSHKTYALLLYSNKNKNHKLQDVKHYILS